MKTKSIVELMVPPASPNDELLKFGGSLRSFDGDPENPVPPSDADSSDDFRWQLELPDEFITESQDILDKEEIEVVGVVQVTNDTSALQFKTFNDYKKALGILKERWSREYETGGFKHMEGWYDL